MSDDARRAEMRQAAATMIATHGKNAKFAYAVMDLLEQVAQLEAQLDERNKYFVLREDWERERERANNQEQITRDEMRRSDEYQAAYQSAENDLTAMRERVEQLEAELEQWRKLGPMG